MYNYAPYSCSVCGDQKRALDALEVELQIIVNYHVSARVKGDPLEELPVLSTDKPSSLHPSRISFGISLEFLAWTCIWVLGWNMSNLNDGYTTEEKWLPLLQE